MGTINNLPPSGPDPNTNAVNALNQITLAIAQLAKTINTVFPTAIAVSTTGIQSGAIVPVNYVGYLTVANPVTGAEIKIGYYNP
jgi:hypothetical protein